MADFNKATIGAVPNPILAEKSDPLHIKQIANLLKTLNQLDCFDIKLIFWRILWRNIIF